MKKKMMVVVVVLLGLMVFPLSWYCTKKTETNVVTNPVADTASDRAQIFVAYDVPPAPVGGFDAIQQNLHYPEEALRAGLAGRVYLNIFIDIEGKIKEAKALKALGTETDLEAHPDLRKNIALPGIDPSVANLCTEAAIAAAKSVNWTPAKQRDKTVEVWVGIPVVFKLDDGATAETLSNYEGTPGPVGGYSDVIEKLGMDIPVDEKEKAMYMRLNMAGLLYCQIDERGKLIKSETQRPVDAECKANFIKAAEEVSWNIVRKNGQAIKYWHKIGLICNDKNTEKEISSTEIESSKLSREAIRAEYKRLGITRTTFSKNNEVETFKNSKAVYFCTVNKDGYVIKANKVKSSGNNNLDNDLLNYIKSHDIVGISGDIKEPVKMYIGLTLSET